MARVSAQLIVTSQRVAFRVRPAAQPADQPAHRDTPQPGGDLAVTTPTPGALPRRHEGVPQDVSHDVGIMQRRVNRARSHGRWRVNSTRNAASSPAAIARTNAASSAPGSA